jgi:protein SCO1
MKIYPAIFRQSCWLVLMLVLSSTLHAAETPQPSDFTRDKGDNAKYFTNLPLLTQDNKRIRFYDDMVQGKIIIMNVMFTTCSMTCSPVTANLARVQQYLGDRVGNDIRMVSISLDPLNDTPERLQKYAIDHSVKPGWFFLTGKKENIDWVLYKIGSYIEEKEQHTNLLIIGNEQTGQWKKMYALASPAEISAEVRKLSQAKP